MNDPPDADRLLEVRAKFSNRFRAEDSINTYYFWMNTQKAPFNDVKGAPGDQLRDRPRGAQPRLRRPTARHLQILLPGTCRATTSSLYPGPDMEAEKLIAEANPTDKDITTWTNDEPEPGGSASTTNDPQPAGLQRRAE